MKVVKIWMYLRPPIAEGKQILMNCVKVHRSSIMFPHLLINDDGMLIKIKNDDPTSSIVSQKT